jgi:8-oxo-dGTP diphosphatase
MDHPPFALTVDVVLLTIREDELQALVVKRGEPPFEGRWALPGGFVRPDEDLHAAARRELREETGVGTTHLEQLKTYGSPKRDPRMRTVSVAHLALAPDLPDAVAGTDASDAAWRPVDSLLAGKRLAFDHHWILRDGVERARAKIEYTALATEFCDEEFTIGELRHVYEVVWGVEIDVRNFHRKASRAPGFLEPTGRTTTRERGRPAQLYRRGDVDVLSPPLTRAG